MAAEGLYDKKNNEIKPMTHDSLNQSNVESVRKTKNRRSKSLDDLLDDQMTIVEDDRETQSMENILESAGSKTDICSATPVSSEKLCENEVMIVDNTMMIQIEEPDDSSQNDSGIGASKSYNSSIDEDTLSNTISLASSTASDKKSGKTFLNKYVKKVKNFIKK